MASYALLLNVVIGRPLSKGAKIQRSRYFANFARLLEWQLPPRAAVDSEYQSMWNEGNQRIGAALILAVLAHRKLAGWILGSVAASGWIAAASLLPWRHTPLAVPQLLLVCATYTEDSTHQFARYHDCSPQPMELKTVDDCNRAMLTGAWVLQAGPVTRALDGKPIRLACVNKSDLQSRYPESKKPPAVTS